MIGFPSSSASTPATPFVRRRPFPFYAEHGMVAAAHPLSVEAGLFILRQGGNAIDAAVATGLAAAVVMPEMCGLGGDLFAIVSVDGRPVSVHGSGKSARNSSIELMRQHGGDKMPYQGPLAVAVPGMVDAYFELLERYGTKSFAEVAEPAISLARDGFALQPLGAKSIAECADLLEQDAAAKAVFLANGRTPRAGDRLVQADLARTLETLARDGVGSFYQGEVGQRITAWLQQNGGVLGSEDFADHTTEFTAPLSTTYRDHTVYQTGLPTQGLILLEALNIVEHGQIRDPQSADVMHLLVEAKKLAYADRLGHAADPAFHETPLASLLSKAWAHSRYSQINPQRAATDVPHGDMQTGDTTYLSVVDEEGRMVSLIQSVSSAFGSGVVGGDTGVVLNNRAGRGFSLVAGHPNLYAPGKRTMHTLNCFLVADENDAPALVGGTPGGDGQPQWNLQMLVGLFDAGMDAQEAIEQPRWTSWPGTDPISIDNPFELRIEDRLPVDTIAALEQRGHQVRRMGPWSGGGAAQIIARNPKTGVMIGGSDSRVEGTVLGF
jgi:gamma-glutamyltranspeptidase / glutathione hydrolase